MFRPCANRSSSARSYGAYALFVVHKPFGQGAAAIRFAPTEAALKNNCRALRSPLLETFLPVYCLLS
ncbi:protein of unknown function [Methylocaldum szegediense]|uniref:Uncharacterized protein n=1 Tax=Methylocaldum szegediense TaxID=73780 RepID=A0ABN8X439_9GAMM|nr:protein of unknown function [Methylocaldum szegediense]